MGQRRSAGIRDWSVLAITVGLVVVGASVVRTRTPSTMQASTLSIYGVRLGMARSEAEQRLGKPVSEIRLKGDGPFARDTRAIYRGCYPPRSTVLTELTVTYGHPGVVEVEGSCLEADGQAIVHNGDPQEVALQRLGRADRMGIRSLAECVGPSCDMRYVGFQLTVSLDAVAVYDRICGFTLSRVWEPMRLVDMDAQGRPDLFHGARATFGADNYKTAIARMTPETSGKVAPP
jgi:hypothetical protein